MFYKPISVICQIRQFFSILILTNFVQFCPILSNFVHFVQLCPYCHFCLFCPTLSNFVQFCLICPIVSILSILPNIVQFVRILNFVHVINFCPILSKINLVLSCFTSYDCFFPGIFVRLYLTFMTLVLSKNN